MNRRSFISAISGLFAASKVAKAAEPEAPQTATEVMIQWDAERPMPAHTEVDVYALEKLEVGDVLDFDWIPVSSGGSLTSVRRWRSGRLPDIWGYAMEKARPGESLRMLLRNRGWTDEEGYHPTRRRRHHAD